MRKAEEKARETYPLRNAEHVYDEERVIEARGYFIQGYHQAEKDLELSWNDIALILNTAEEFNRKNTVPILDKDYFSEILKRFKDYKK